MVQQHYVQSPHDGKQQPRSIMNTAHLCHADTIRRSYLKEAAS
jgi:hypothetical protein